MKPTEFPEQNIVIAKDQPEYIPLPANVNVIESGRVVTCWQMSLAERIKALLTGKVWLSQLTFNMPLQPVRLDIEKPRSI